MTFLNTTDYPKLSVFVDNFETIHNEYKNYMYRSKASRTITWPDKELHNGTWKVVPLIFKNKKINNKEIDFFFKNTFKTLYSFANPYIAAFSILRPGTIIEPHKGYTSDVLRLHLPIEVPSTNIEECGIMVDGEIRPWIAKELLLFDDMLEHSAWNRCNISRVVLLVDYYKDDLV